MDDRATRIHVLLTKARNMYTSAFTELNKVREELGSDDKFVDWCHNELRISSSYIYKWSEVLKDVDTARVKADMAMARKIEAERKKAEAEAKAAVIAEARASMEAKKRASAEESKKAARKASKREIDRRYRAKKGVLLAAQSSSLVWNSTIAAKRARAARELAIKSDSNWIDASVVIAQEMAAARAAHVENQAFHTWLKDSTLDSYGHSDRAALIKLGQREDLRQILVETKSRSYQSIWMASSYFKEDGKENHEQNQIVGHDVEFDHAADGLH